MILPQTLPEPVDGQQISRFNPFISDDLVRSSQNIEKFNMITLRDIFYFVSIMNITRTDLDSGERDLLVERVRSYQNSDGGFGDWPNDRSKAGTTLTALRTLGLLESDPLNRSGAIDFISRLQVSGLDYGNFGFRSSVKEGDADISSTYDAIVSLTFLEAEIPNSQGVIDYIMDHQNSDGGFGYQTNRESGIFWDSTVLHTHRGLISLDIFDSSPLFKEEAIIFIRSHQGVDGGYSNIVGDIEKISYTFNAVTSFKNQEEDPPRAADTISFVNSLKMSDGGYLDDPLDTKTGLHTTYFALKILTELDSQIDGISAAVFARNYFQSRLDGGFGDYPGLGSTSRVTFNAISTLNRLGDSPQDKESSTRFIEMLRNPDGGYGSGGTSNVETTYRSVLSLMLLGRSIPDYQHTVLFVRSLQNDDGGFPFAEGYPSRGAYTYRALRTLDLLGSKPLNTNGASVYLHSLMNSDGGFGNYFGESSSDIASTYRAIRGLDILKEKPIDVEKTHNFILNSQNEDGGFRRSPSDITYPGNLSTSYYTYDAVLALEFLGKELMDKGSIYHFIKSLRNPDLGFGEKESFTSSVSDTFSSIWSYEVLFQDQFWAIPTIGTPEVDPKDPDTNDTIELTVDIGSSMDQRPETVIADVDGNRFPMFPVKKGKWTYGATFELPSGEHPLVIEVFDGKDWIGSSGTTIQIEETRPVPILDIFVSPKEGLSDTVFRFETNYSHPLVKEAQIVQISLDNGNWINITDILGDLYIQDVVLEPGVHNARSRAFDGQTWGYSELLTGPVVYTIESKRPDWATFLKIKVTMNESFDLSISYVDVERSHTDGKLTWSVNTTEGLFIFENDGSLYTGKSENGNGSFFWFALFIAIIVILLVSFFVFKNFRDRKEEENI